MQNYFSKSVHRLSNHAVCKIGLRGRRIRKERLGKGSRKTINGKGNEKEKMQRREKG